MLNLDINIKVTFKSNNVKKKNYSFLHPFSNYLKLNNSVWIAPTYRWVLYDHFGVWKRWGNETYQSTSKSPSWPSWFVKKLNAWWCWLAHLVNLFPSWYIDIPNRVDDTVWNSTILKGKIILRSAIQHYHAFFISQGNLRMSTNQFWSLLNIRQKPAKNFPSRKLEYLSPQTCYIVSR